MTARIRPARRTLWLATVASVVAASACGAPLQEEAEKRQPDETPSLNVPRTYVVGLPFELWAQSPSFYWLPIIDARCEQGCRIERIQEGGRPKPTVAVVPLAPSFTVAVDIARTPTSPPSEIVTVTETHAAEVRELRGSGDGLRSGVAILLGTELSWSFDVGGKVSWITASHRRTVDGDAFEIVGEGLKTTARAVREGKTTISVETGDLRSTAELVCAHPKSVRTLALASKGPADEAETPLGLTAKSSHAIVLRAGEEAEFWVVFTTANGQVGVGGAEATTPAPLAPFTLEAPDHRWSEKPPEPRRTIRLRGDQPGASTLTLRIGNVTAVVAVEVR